MLDLVNTDTLYVIPVKYAQGTHSVRAGSEELRQGTLV